MQRKAQQLWRLQGEVLSGIANTFHERIQAAGYLLHVSLVPKFSHRTTHTGWFASWAESPVAGLGLGNWEFIYIRDLYFQPTPFVCPCLWLLKNLSGGLASAKTRFRQLGTSASKRRAEQADFGFFSSCTSWRRRKRQTWCAISTRVRTFAGSRLKTEQAERNVDSIYWRRSILRY